MGYQILFSTSPGWEGSPIVANLLTKIDSLHLARSVWETESLENLPELEFSINTVKSLPDFISSGVVWLFSDRFIELLRNYGVLFESFPVVLKNEEDNNYHYRLFHLLQRRPIIDIEKSKINGYGNVDYIKLLDLAATPELAMVRDSFLAANVFVQDDLVKKIQQYDISGCGWLNPDKFSFHFRTKHW